MKQHREQQVEKSQDLEARLRDSVNIARSVVDKWLDSDKEDCKTTQTQKAGNDQKSHHDKDMFKPRPAR